MRKRSPTVEDLSGRNNADLEAARGRLIRGNTYRDLSTVMVMPTRGMIPAKVYMSHMSLSKAMNQKFWPLVIEKDEVADAYNHAVEIILSNPETAKWKFLFTVEEDNTLPQDALLKLYESIGHFDAISGLYWTKGLGGQPMIYGDPKVMPRNYIPQVPIPDTVQQCNGIGMGCALFRLDLFKKVDKPWFQTKPNGTQDLMFCEKAHKIGARFAVDTRVRVGHLDPNTGEIW